MPLYVDANRKFTSRQAAALTINLIFCLTVRIDPILGEMRVSNSGKNDCLQQRTGQGELTTDLWQASH